MGGTPPAHRSTQTTASLKNIVLKKKKSPPTPTPPAAPKKRQQPASTSCCCCHTVKPWRRQNAAVGCTEETGDGIRWGGGGANHRGKGARVARKLHVANERANHGHELYVAFHSCNRPVRPFGPTSTPAQNNAAAVRTSTVPSKKDWTKTRYLCLEMPNKKPTMSTRSSN